MYEPRTNPPLPRPAFLRRLAAHVAFSIALIFISLLIGLFGYRYIGQFSWIDSFLNAAMIMGGMGQVNPLDSDGAKIFAGCYALYSGLVLLVSVGILSAPIFHRILHKFHWEESVPRF